MNFVLTVLAAYGQSRPSHEDMEMPPAAVVIKQASPSSSDSSPIVARPTSGLMRYLTKRKIRYAIGIVYGTLNVSEMMWNFKTTFEYYDGNKTKKVFLSEPVCALKHEDIKYFPFGWKLMINGEEYTVMGDEIHLTGLSNTNVW